MSGGPFLFILCIIGMSMAAWVITTWIRVRHGYPLDDGAGNVIRKDELSESRQIELLSEENAELKGKLSRLEGRIAVLERIATDPAERTAREIEDLR